MSVAVLEKPDAPADAGGAERLFIAMNLADEMYGLDIGVVHSVITPQAITHVPNAPPFVRGVINLRGRILPVVDLRARFGLAPRDADQNRRARIVIVETEGLSAGLIVDAVSEVLRLPSGAIEPPSHLVTSAGTDGVTGLGRLPDGRLLILLDVFETVSPPAGDA